MACVVRQGTYSLVWTILMFCSTVNGVAQTTVSCGESGSKMKQPQTLICNVTGAVENNIYWFRYNNSYNEVIINCFKTLGGDIGTCLTSNKLLYDVSDQPQQPKQQVFTIFSVSAEDLQVSWLCVDRTSFPDRASINTDSTCKLKEENITTPSSSPTTDNGETTTILPTLTTEAPGSCCIWDDCTHCSTVGGVVFIIDLVAGVVVFLVIIFVINKGLSIPIKIGIIGVFAVVSGILGGGLYAACIDCISFGGIVGIDIGCMVPVSVITIVVVKYSCNETKK